MPVNDTFKVINASMMPGATTATGQTDNQLANTTARSNTSADTDLTGGSLNSGDGSLTKMTADTYAEMLDRQERGLPGGTLFEAGLCFPEEGDDVSDPGTESPGTGVTGLTPGYVTVTYEDVVYLVKGVMPTHQEVTIRRWLILSWVSNGRGAKWGKGSSTSSLARAPALTIQIKPVLLAWNRGVPNVRVSEAEYMNGRGVEFKLRSSSAVGKDLLSFLFRSPESISSWNDFIAKESLDAEEEKLKNEVKERVIVKWNAYCELQAAYLKYRSRLERSGPENSDRSTHLAREDDPTSGLTQMNSSFRVTGSSVGPATTPANTYTDFNNSMADSQHQGVETRTVSDGAESVSRWSIEKACVKLESTKRPPTLRILVLDRLSKETTTITRQRSKDMPPKKLAMFLASWEHKNYTGDTAWAEKFRVDEMQGANARQAILSSPKCESVYNQYYDAQRRFIHGRGMTS